ncbi:AfsR/SARP family transcriptional regulator [Kitasatospora sp. NPDC093550]|uniref:AfsR/SARP family transcriptional regulator n=1 Tax=Kitasatospora sp. NPDC093550 TaxID=3364089 RepID=UPI003805258D
MEFRLLGPEEVLCGDQAVAISAAKHRAVLSLLLLRSGRVVSTEDLIDGLWGAEPPKTARTTLHNYIRRLRGILGDRGADLLRTRPGGYSLGLESHRLDVHEFEELVRRADGAQTAGDLPAASELLRRALRLWRGRALEGTASRYLAEVEAPRLDEARRSAFEALMDVDLRLGRHAALLGEMRRELEREPLRERLRAQYMLALYRADRRADALDAYREGRRLLVRELGLEPGPELAETERAILADSPGLRSPAAAGATAVTTAAPPGNGAPAESVVRTPVPWQLPADNQHFTGRLDQLRVLEEWADEQGAAAPMVITADGRGGVGKTALAVRWGHAARVRFPDGQLYIDLRGYSTCRPVAPLEALTAFLYALGVPCDRIPGRLDRAVGLYRTLVAGKRILIVLDNARNVAQVRDLLPGTPGSNVVVTSRDVLAGLVIRDNARHLRVDALSPAEAATLLERLVGASLVAAEPEAAAELARLCGHLPLALGVAAVNVLAAGGEQPVADYVARLRSADRRLCALSVPEDEASDLQAVFAVSYLSLSREERTLFRRLSLVPGPTATTGAAAALLGLPPARTAQVLKRLVAAHLVGRPDYDAFQLHDLLRLHAEERAAAEDSAGERAAALRRLYDYYLTGVHAGARLLYPEKLRVFAPGGAMGEATGGAVSEAAGGAGETAAVGGAVGMSDRQAALDWFRRERTNLALAVQRAAGLGLHAAAWKLCDGLRGYFALVRTAPDWIAVSEAAIQAAQSSGEVVGAAAARLSLGDAHRSLGQYGSAVRHYGTVLEFAEFAGWRAGKAEALVGLGLVDVLTGRPRDAARRYEEALALVPGDPQWVALRLNAEGAMALLRQELGDLRAAERHGRAALGLSRRLDSRGAEGVAQATLGQLLALLGRSEEALDRLTDALAIHREVGDRGSEAQTLRGLADWHRDRDDPGTALDLATAAVALADEIGETRPAAAALVTAGSAHARRGDPTAAERAYDRAHDLAELAGDRHAETEVLVGRAELCLLSGHLADADEHGRSALARARAEGYRILEGQALTLLGRAALTDGRPDDAAGLAAEAAAVLAETGHRSGLDDARGLLSRARRQTSAGRGRDQDQERDRGRGDGTAGPAPG